MRGRRDRRPRRRICAATRPDGAEVVDCKGHVLCPGLIDMQVFTGEPGYEHRETLKTASHAAAAGGVTTIVVMPDTDPVIDQVALVDFIQRRARDNAVVNVHAMAAMTKGLEGEEMTEIGLLQAGRRHRLLQRQDERRQHARDAQRAALRQGLRRADRAPHRGPVPRRRRGHERGRGGDAARPAGRRTRRPRRSCSSATCASSRSPAGAITPRRISLRREPRRDPRGQGAQAAGHLRRLDQSPDAERERHRPLPHLLQGAPAAALARTTAPPWCAALAAGDIDVIVSSHDPQDADVKRRPFAEAADGAIGLETLLAAALRLYHNGELALLPLLRAMTINPARAARPAVAAGSPRARRPTSSLVDLGQPWVVDKDAAALALEELAVRREQDAGPRAAHPGCRQHGLPVRWPSSAT